MKKLRAGVIGLGQSAWLLDEDPARDTIWSHVGAYTRHELTEVVGACDVDPAKTEAFSRAYGVNVYTDVGEMLANEALDIVSVCVPSAQHESVVGAVVAHSNVKAIFCEKPMGTDEREATRIAETCDRANRVLAVNYMRRWDLAYVGLRDLIDSGALGRLSAVVGYGPTALRTSASHLIDLLLFFGGRPACVAGDLQTDVVRLVEGEPDPGGVALLKFENGTAAFLKATMASPQHYMFDVDLLFTEGRALVADDGRTCRRWGFSDTPTSTGSGYKTLHEMDPPVQAAHRPRLLAALDDIIDCIETGVAPRSGSHNAIDVHRIINLIKESARHGGCAVKF